uniref:Extracellular sulfatase C-terminal domain-containing protein n=1 Tax=Ditylenchus dipsaci TaxID=166011 RepID=A0A915D4B9_9BILA
MELAALRYLKDSDIQHHWKCVHNELGQWRIHKCRLNQTPVLCDCNKKRRRSRSVEPFKKDDDDHPVNEQPEFDPHTLDVWEDEFLREVQQQELVESGQWFQGVFDFQSDEDQTLEGSVRSRRHLNGSQGSESELHRRRTRLDTKIRTLRKKLTAYKDIRKALRLNRHNDSNATTENPCKCDFPKSHPGSLFDRNHTNKTCNLPQMNCFLHDSTHWKTPPQWPVEFGGFCFCQNSNNNTYWCLRTINETHNFLYCEFITEFVSFYDLRLDPFQLSNIVYQLEPVVLEQLSLQLRKLKSCRSSKECEHYSSAKWYDAVDGDDEETNY